MYYGKTTKGDIMSPSKAIGEKILDDAKKDDNKFVFAKSLNELLGKRK